MRCVRQVVVISAGVLVVRALAGCSPLSSEKPETDSSDSESDSMQSSLDATSTSTQHDSSEDGISDSATSQVDSSEDSDNTVGDDPRCNNPEPNRSDNQVCDEGESVRWIGVWLPGVANKHRCLPACISDADSSGGGYPFASLEECMEVCPKAKEIPVDGTELEICLWSIEGWNGADVTSIVLEDNALVYNYWIPYGCPLREPTSRLCWLQEHDTILPDGGRRIVAEFYYDGFGDICDETEKEYKRTFDLTRVLDEVKERPLVISFSGTWEQQPDISIE